MTEREILLDAIDTYGKDAQLKMLLEEMSELQKEICKHWRGKNNPWDISDEIADVEIMLEQVKMIFLCGEDVARRRKFKVDRLARRLKEAHEND